MGLAGATEPYAVDGVHVPRVVVASDLSILVFDILELLRVDGAIFDLQFVLLSYKIV